MTKQFEINPIVPFTRGGQDFSKDNIRKYEPVDTGSGYAKIYDGLTAKQENYCRHIANGESSVESYRKAFGIPESRKNHHSIYNRASTLAKKPEIKARIEQLVTEREALAITDYVRIRAFIIERLQMEALQAKNDAVRVRALELLGKVDKIQLFQENQLSDDKAPKDVGKELETRLSKLFGKKIEVERSKKDPPTN